MPVVNPGIRRFLASAIQRLFNGASFSAPLTHSLVPERGTGSATFTRATTATVKDHEGVLRTAIAGEARFEGARRVRNLLTYTEDFSNAAWVASNVTKASGVSDPLGTSRAGTITATANNGLMYQAVTPPAATGYVALNSVYIRRRTGTGAIYFRTANNVDVDVTSSVTTSWTRIYSTPTAPAAGTWYFVVKLATSGDAVDVYAPQLEDITGRADQTTPSEYVSVGVPTDWLGTEHVTNGTFDSATTGWTADALSGADSVLSIVGGKLRVTNTGATYGCAYQTIATVVGTKYVVRVEMTLGTCPQVSLRVGSTGFASYEYYDVALTATGGWTTTFTATTTATTLTLLNRNDSGAYSDFDNISVKPAYYHGSFVDGVKCFATDINGSPIPSSTLLGYQAEGARTNLALQSQTFDNASWTKSAGGGGSVPVVTADQTTAPDGTLTADKVVFAAPVSGDISSLNQSPVLAAGTYTGSLYIKAFAAGDIGKKLGFRHAAGGAYSLITLTADWQRFSSIEVRAANYYELLLRPSEGTSSGTVSCYLWGAQLELGSFASSYIATTTAAVTRNADVEAVSTSGNIAAAAGSVYLEYTPTHSPSGTIAFWGTYVDASNYTAIIHDATNLIFRKRIAGVNYDATIANAFVSGTTYKACATWGASGTSITLNGTEGTPHANTTAAQIAATMQWGADGNSLQQPFASVRNCRDWLRQLSASERAAVTA